MATAKLLKQIILAKSTAPWWEFQLTKPNFHILLYFFPSTFFHLTMSSHSAYLSPLLRAIPMSFSMPPASLRALVFSMFLVMTSCRAQQIAVMVSSDMVFPTRLLVLPPPPPPPPPLLLLLLLPPGKRCTRSLMAYLPDMVVRVRASVGVGRNNVGCVEERRKREWINNVNFG